tara:strand:+ start:4926 stop:6572 length:1647 start_codon:yes stop_codon:yes gene_type:complete
MPTVTLNKTVLEKLIGKKLPLEKLKDRISYLGTDLESVEGDEITVEIFPNRPDLVSEQGLARALATFIGAKKGLKKYDIKPSNEKITVEKPVKTVRPYTVAAIIKNLKLDNEKIREIIQIQEKMHISYGRNRKKVAIGIYPMEEITMPITYTAKKPEEIIFQPLDADKEMNAKELLETHPTGKEYSHLLKDAKLYPVFIDAKGDVLSVPPIINSEKTGRVSTNTTEVFIEFSGHNLLALQKGLNMFVTCLADMGGTIYSMEISDTNKLTTPDLSPEEMSINLEYVNKRLGLNLKESEIKTLLEKMGYDYNNKKVSIPAYRADIIHPVDLIEDIAIAYGYENFQEEIPKVATIGSEDQFELFQNKLATLLIGLGITEVKTYHLANTSSQKNKMNCDIPLIEIKNPSSQEYNMLRAWIIPSVMEVLADNKHNEYPQHIFDTGSIFKKNSKSETGILEHKRLAITLAEDTADFTQIKKVLDYLMTNIDVQYEIIETTHPTFIEGRVGRVKVKNIEIGYIGEISPKVLNNFTLEYPVCALELNLSELYKLIF